jgi:hypothetical protein
MYRDKATYITIRLPSAEADNMKAFADRTRGGNITGTIRAALKAFIAAEENVKTNTKVLEKA